MARKTEKAKDRVLTLEAIEDAIEHMCRKNPEFISPVTWHDTGMCNSKGEALYLANIGTHGHPVYIGGTKQQLERRINTFYKHLLYFI